MNTSSPLPDTELRPDSPGATRPLKILIVSQVFPFPPYESGAKLTSYQIIRELSKSHQITVMTFLHGDQDKLHIRELEAICQSSRCVTVRTYGALQKCWHRVFSLLPPDTRPYTTREARESVRELIHTGNFDVVHLEGLQVAPLVADVKPLPCVLAPHDCASLFVEQEIHQEKTFARKLWRWLVWRRVVRLEKTVFPQADACIMIAERDSQHLRKHCPALPVHTIPNGVDTECFRPSPEPREGTGRLLFTGRLDFGPNVDAATYFAESIFPLLLARRPAAELWIVGANPGPELLRLSANPHIHVEGPVEDLRPYFNRSQIYVAPMRWGTGMKMKVLEALAMGKAIVASPEALHGFEARSEEHLLVACSPEEFVDQILRLIGDAALRERLGRAARRLIEEQHSWEACIRRYEALYGKAMEGACKRRV